jgi:hypothetical protein
VWISHNSAKRSDRRSYRGTEVRLIRSPIGDRMPPVSGTNGIFSWDIVGSRSSTWQAAISPCRVPTKDNVTVFNGEIYNFPELRDQLLQGGCLPNTKHGRVPARAPPLYQCAAPLAHPRPHHPRGYRGPLARQTSRRSWRGAWNCTLSVRTTINSGRWQPTFILTVW